MPNSEEEIARENMLGLLRAKKTVNEWSPSRPTDWRPNDVQHPIFGDYFSLNECWNFIENKLSEGHPIEIVSLEKPPGKRGYVMKVEATPRGRIIYIKLEIGTGGLVGRSFHYSEYY